MKIFVKCFASIFLLLLAIKTTSVFQGKIVTKSSPEVSPILYTTNSKALIKKNIELLSKAEIQESDKVKITNNSLEILKNAPLNADALVHFGLISPDENLTRKFLDLAFKRKARSRANIYLLTYHNVQKKNYAEALKYLDILFRLNPNNRRQLETTITRFLRSPESREIALDFLKIEPDWARAFYSRYVKNATIDDLRIIQPNINNFRKSDRSVNLTVLRQQFLTRMFGYEMINETMASWKALEDPKILNKKKSRSLNFNPDFENISAFTPINWRLLQGDAQLVDYDAQAGIFLSVISTRPKMIATQLLENPGQSIVELKTSYSIQSKLRKASLEVKVKCASNKAEIDALRLTIDTTPDTRSMTISLPDKSSCPYLILEVWVNPTPLSKRVSGNIQSIELSVAR